MTDSTETAADERSDRDERGRFSSGNPGRPLGSRHEALKALDAIGAENAAAVIKDVVEAAKGGDMRAAEILLKRLWPEGKGRPVALALAQMDNPAGIVSALAAVAEAVSRGDVTP